MRAGRFALAHYINLLSRYKNALSTFGSKIRPYIFTYIHIFTQNSVVNVNWHINKKKNLNLTNNCQEALKKKEKKKVAF